MPRYLITCHPFVCGLECDFSARSWRAIRPIASNILHDAFGPITRDTAVFAWGNYQHYQSMGLGQMWRDFTVLKSAVSGAPTIVFDEFPGPDETVACYMFDPKQNRFIQGQMKANDDQFDIERLWIGIVAKGGGTLGVVGKEIALGALGNVSSKMVFPFLATSTRAGLGLGVAGGLAFGLAYGFTNPRDFVGTDTSNMLDFSLALGPKWGSFLKSANPKALKTNLAIVNASSIFLREIQGTLKSTQALVNGASKFVNSEAGVNLAKSLAGVSVLDTGGPNFTAFDFPAGAGTELAVYTNMGSIKAVDAPSVESYLKSIKDNPFGAS